jgi:hypothetical protein
MPGSRYCSGRMVCSTHRLVDVLCELDAAAAKHLLSELHLVRVRHTSLLSQRHPLCLGKLDQLHAEDVHKLGISPVEDVLEDPCVRPEYFYC